MAHMNKISRVPWVRPQNLLGCGPRQLGDEQESLLDKASSAFPDQFDDASVVDDSFVGAGGAVQESDRQLVVGTSTQGDHAPFYLHHRNQQQPCVFSDLSSAAPTTTRLHRQPVEPSPSLDLFGIDYSTRGQRLRMDVLLLAAEHELTPNPYRTGDSSILPRLSRDRTASSPRIMGQAIPDSMKARRWCNVTTDTNDDMTIHLHSSSAVAGGSTISPLSHEEHTGFKHFYEYEEESSSEEEDIDEEEDELEEYAQTVVVIRNGEAQYTIHRMPTPTKSRSSGADDDSSVDEEDGGSPCSTESSRSVSSEESFVLHNGQSSNGNHVSFQERLVQMKKYKKRHGELANFSVGDRNLSQFISNQRCKYRQGLLTSNRVNRFRELKVPGFGKRGDPMPKKKGGTSKSNQSAEKETNTSTESRSKRKAPTKETAAPKSPSSSESREPNETVAKKRKAALCSPIICDATVSAEHQQVAKKQRVSRRPGRFTDDEAPSPPAVASLPTRPKPQPRPSNKKNHGKRGQPTLFVKFEERIAQLLDYEKRHGNMAVPANKNKDSDGELGRWLAAQRSLKRKGLLKAERLQELRRIKCDSFC